MYLDKLKRIDWQQTNTQMQKKLGLIPLKSRRLIQRERQKTQHSPSFQTLEKTKRIQRLNKPFQRQFVKVNQEKNKQSTIISIQKKNDQKKYYYQKQSNEKILKFLINVPLSKSSKINIISKYQINKKIQQQKLLIQKQRECQNSFQKQQVVKGNNSQLQDFQKQNRIFRSKTNINLLSYPKLQNLYNKQKKKQQTALQYSKFKNNKNSKIVDKYLYLERRKLLSLKIDKINSFQVQQKLNAHINISNSGGIEKCNISNFRKIEKCQMPKKLMKLQNEILKTKCYQMFSFLQNKRSKQHKILLRL